MHRSIVKISFIVFCSLLSTYAFDGIPNLRALANLNSFASNDFINTMTDIKGAENSVDGNLYRIGGGDAFSIAVVGLPSAQYTISVDQTGKLYIPEVGILSLKGVLLNEALDTIAHFIKTKLNLKNEIYVTLAQTKEVLISVTGPVANPGSYEISGAYRVLDAIKNAHNNSLPSIEEFQYREVRCKSGDSVQTLDLLKYLLGNDSQSNPYLNPGDHISISMATRRVRIEGPIKNTTSKFIPIKKNESAKEFLSLFVFNEAADSHNIVIHHIGDDGKAINHTVSWDELGAITLHDNDVVVVPRKRNYPKVHMVRLVGEFASPGEYPVFESSTSVKNLMQQAGGFSPHARTDKVVIIRKNASLTHNIGKGFDDRLKISQIKAIGDIPSIRPEISIAFNKLQLTNDFSVREVPADNFEEKVTGDDIVVALKKENMVYISGNVRNPGAYQFQSDKGYGYYIRAAGGYTGKADRSNVFVVSQYHDVLQIKEKRQLGEGDILVVPDSQQYKKIGMIILPALQALATTVGVVISILSFTANNK